MRRYFGHAGHFVAAAQCRYHIHTHVGKFCVSTVGDYYPRSSRDGDPPEQIGHGRLFETMVFDLGDDGNPSTWSELDMDAYNDADAANAGHESMVQKYEAKL